MCINMYIRVHYVYHTCKCVYTYMYSDIYIYMCIYIYLYTSIVLFRLDLLASTGPPHVAHGPS